MQFPTDAVPNPPPKSIHCSFIERWALEQLRKFCNKDVDWILAVSQGVNAVERFRLFAGKREFEAATDITPYDPWADEFYVRGDLDDNDFSLVAQEAEALVKEISTPSVGGPVTISEVASEEVTKVDKINLLKQKRTSFSILKARAPKDQYIVAVQEYLAKAYKPDQAMTLEDQLHIAAIEIVYSYSPQELWGSAEIAKQIRILLEAHSEDAQVMYEQR